MSRIGKKPVTVPMGVTIAVSDRSISVEGPKGKLAWTHRPEVRVSADGQQVCVSIDESLVGDRKVRALWGTTRALINNMIVGVSQGYEKKLEIHGVGWTAQVAGQTLKLNVGFANSIEMPIPTGVNVTVEKQFITINGADKQAIGQFAAAARAKRPPEPYNGKGIRYSTEIVRKKEGKQFGK
ncbi:MAG: 50S ribosomal protein L6 [Phycisphaeraceae bacterium]|nr:MAG: 50S ribosomal protein L6 [Phycisphaeraceae bacterium]